MFAKRLTRFPFDSASVFLHLNEMIMQRIITLCVINVKRDVLNIGVHAYSGLHHAGKAECDKLAKLKPQRYVLMTSCPLTPANKAQVVEALAPFCRDAGDIWGRDELDAALARHPQVLHGHVGLWLQDEAQLQLVLHNGAIAHLTSVHPRYDTRILLKECRALLSELRVMWPDEDVHWLYRLIDFVAGGELS